MRLCIRSYKATDNTNVRGAHTDQVHHLESFQKLTVPVFQSVGLIDDHATPWNVTQLGAVSQDHFKRGDNGMELVGPFYHTTLGRTAKSYTP